MHINNTRKIRLAEIEENRFYKMPKFLIHDEQFNNLSSDAKILYMVMRDRHELSLKNNWVDSEGYVYVIYTRENMMEDVNLSNKTVIKAVKELKKYGLIEEKRQGVNKPNMIYILTLDIEYQWKCKNYTSRSVKTTHQEVKNLHPNDTNINDTNINEKMIDDTQLSTSNKKTLTSVNQSSSQINESLMKKFRDKWLQVVGKRVVLSAANKLRLTALADNYGEDELLEAINRIAESDYLKTVITITHFITKFDDIANGKYTTWEQVANNTPSKATTTTKKNKFVDACSSHNHDMDALEALEAAKIAFDLGQISAEEYNDISKKFFEVC